MCKLWTSRYSSWIYKSQRNQRSNYQHLLYHQKKARESSTSALLTMPKPLTVWITINCGKFWKRWEYQTTLPASWEICMLVNTQQLEPGGTDWFQIGKGLYIQSFCIYKGLNIQQGCILSPCLFNLYAEYIMRNAGLDDWVELKTWDTLLRSNSKDDMRTRKNGHTGTDWPAG